MTYAWLDAHGDDTLAVEWPLTPDSVVFEVGGYEGRWASQIAERYNPHLFVFEPQAHAFGIARNKLAGYPKVRMFNFGLAPMNAEMELWDYGTDAGSFVRDEASRLYPGNRQATGRVVDIAEFLQEMEVSHIDLMLMNIEGYEFTLLPYMIGKKITDAIDYLMVQFHMFVDDAESLRSGIDWGLAQTHTLLWDYSPTAVCWQRRGVV